MGSHSELLATAVEAARAGAAAVMAAHGAGGGIPYTLKGQNDFVTEVDRRAEAAIVGVIRSRHPDHAVLAEESEPTDPGGAIRWIIDPLDGTTNFIHGYPVFSVSVAAARSRKGGPRAGDVVAGAVLDPVRGELFTAEAGEGAHLDGRRLRVSARESLETTLLLTGFPFRAQALLPAYLAIFADLHRASQGIRRAGSAALDLASVAAGRADGFFEFALSPWDVAAGGLLVTEAGGVLRDFEGGDAYFESGHIVAAASSVAGELLAVIARHYPEGKDGAGPARPAREEAP